MKLKTFAVVMIVLVMVYVNQIPVFAFVKTVFQDQIVQLKTNVVILSVVIMATVKTVNVSVRSAGLVLNAN